jgi:hypothetical protein
MAYTYRKRRLTRAEENELYSRMGSVVGTYTPAPPSAACNQPAKPEQAQAKSRKPTKRNRIG